MLCDGFATATKLLGFQRLWGMPQKALGIVVNYIHTYIHISISTSTSISISILIPISISAVFACFVSVCIMLFTSPNVGLRLRPTPKGFPEPHLVAHFFKVQQTFVVKPNHLWACPNTQWPESRGSDGGLLHAKRQISINKCIRLNVYAYRERKRINNNQINKRTNTYLFTNIYIYIYIYTCI